MNQRILVVEDSETQALKLRLTLEERGWEVTTAATGDAALKALSGTRPDLIVVDYHLPGMQGDELCRRIQMNVDTRGIPILMLTADDGHAAELRGLDSGADDYVVKSADSDVLMLRIQALLRKSRAQASILEGGEAGSHNARLMLVDDSLTYLEYLGAELEAEGWIVEKASGGEDALRRAAAHPVDCVLVDLIMPGMDGIEVCRRFAEMRRSMDNPIVVMMLTSSETKEDMTRGLEAGADDFVGKSSDMAVLKARIRALLRRKFFQEENQRILQELTEREVEAVKARAAQEAAEAKAALAERLERVNQELEQTNARLRHTQAQLIHSEKMASLGQLVAGIAHEINNPLTFVASSVHTIGERLRKAWHDLEPASSQTSRDLVRLVFDRLENVRSGVDRVKDLVLKLRTFSRLDEGVFKTVDVHESIEAALLFLHHRMKTARGTEHGARGKGVSAPASGTPEDRPGVENRIAVVRDYCTNGMLGCYAGELNQVFLNVLANAVDAIENEGTITIATRRENGRFTVSIRDTGRGMAPDVQQRIFDPFFTTKDVGQGTGLGLSISYGIVEAHGGMIAVQSEVGKGTEFRIEIPEDLVGPPSTCAREA